MSDFGTGLRAHLARSRGGEERRLATPPAVTDELAAERARLEAWAAELAGKELALAQREADLEAARERLALTLAGALLKAAEESNVPPPLDEVALARARRYAAS